MHGTLRLNEADILREVLSHIFHVVLTWMKNLGIDGLLMGDLLEEVMSGPDPIQMLPLNEEATETNPLLEDYIRSWWVNATLTVLNTKGWFTEGHGPGGYIW